MDEMLMPDGSGTQVLWPTSTRQVWVSYRIRVCNHIKRLVAINRSSWDESGIARVAVVVVVMVGVVPMDRLGLGARKPF